MSSIRFALEKLDNAVEMLDCSVCNVENSLDRQRHQADNVVDVNFVAQRLDQAIETIENCLKDEE